MAGRNFTFSFVMPIVLALFVAAPESSLTQTSSSNGIPAKALGRAGTQRHISQHSRVPARRSDEWNQKDLRHIQQNALKRLATLARDAVKIADTAARVRVQSRIADVLWGRDERLARTLFQTAYDGSSGVSLSSGYDTVVNPSCGAVRSEIVRAVNGHDPRLASHLIKDGRTDTSCDFGSRERNTYEDTYSVLLVEVASALASQDPLAAAGLGHQSLSGGIVFSFPDLLLSLEKKDPESARRLLDAALLRIETDQINALEILTLARYLLGDEVSRRPPNEQSTAQDSGDAYLVAVIRFLDSAVLASSRFVSGIEQDNWAAGQGSGPFSDQASSEEIAASFFTALTDLLPAFERYHQRRLPDARAIIERLKRRMDPISREHMFVFYDNGDTPESLVAEAEATSDPNSKCELYSLATSLADQKGDYEKALAIASKIEDVEKRVEALDGVWGARIAKAVNAGEYVEASRLVQQISRPERRIMELVMVARQAAQSGHPAQATNMLDQARSLLLRIERFATPEHAEELMQIGQVYARVDASRGFEVMKAAIDMINVVERLPRGPGGHRRFGRPIGPTDSLSLFGTNLRGFEALARSDYIKALRLAQRFDNNALSIAAQLAVVRIMLPST